MSRPFDSAQWDTSHLTTTEICLFVPELNSGTLKIKLVMLLKLNFPTRFPAERFQPSFDHTQLIDRPSWFIVSGEI